MSVYFYESSSLVRVFLILIFDYTISGFVGFEVMNWIQRKIYLYNVTFGLYMLDWWERYLFSILYCFPFSNLLVCFICASQIVIQCCVLINSAPVEFTMFKFGSLLQICPFAKKKLKKKKKQCRCYLVIMVALTIWYQLSSNELLE